MGHSSGESALCSALHEIDGDVVAAVAERLFGVARIVCNSEGEADEHVLGAVEAAWVECKDPVVSKEAEATDSFERLALRALAKRLMKIRSDFGAPKSNRVESLISQDEEDNFLRSFAKLESGSRLIIALVDVEQISLAEVSTILGLGQEHVRRKLNRARLQLSDAFANFKNADLKLRGEMAALSKTSAG